MYFDNNWILILENINENEDAVVKTFKIII